MPAGSTVRFYGATIFEVAKDYYGGESDDASFRWAIGRIRFHSYGFVRDRWPITKSPTAQLVNRDVGNPLNLPVRRVEPAARMDRQWRDDAESKYHCDDFQHLCIREGDAALRSHGPFAHANDAAVPWRTSPETKAAAAAHRDLFGFAEPKPLRRIGTTRW